MTKNATKKSDALPKNGVDEKLIRQLADLLKETGLSELEVEVGSMRVRLGQHGTPMTVHHSAPAASAPVAAPAPEAAPAPAAKDHPGAVISPMVGTVYVSKEPGAAPFVKVGDQVSAGQTLFIVEAMKVMNPIPAHKGGKVTQILINDAQPLEFGDVMAVIE